MPDIWFAWCFSHGRLHTFHPSAGDPLGAWCGALWTRLNGTDEEAAVADKQARYGDAQFIDHLPLDEQLAIHEDTAPGRLHRG